MPTRGERLNNPGNIRITNQQWVGKITPSVDSQFEQFDTPEHGIRAMAKIILTYFHNGINTIDGVINKWAPPSENPTTAYIANVCKWCGYSPDSQLMFTSLDDLSPVILGMINQEQGGCIYTMEQIKTGCQMALGTT